MKQKLSLIDLNLTNFATFTNQRIQFESGFNAIIGETGSGKSLILEALQLILGHRADKKIIRKNCEYAVIEASFSSNCPKVKKYLDHLGFPFENEVVIKRIIYKTGRTKSFLNLQVCSLSTIINFTSNFVDLVGQFENQRLLSNKYQLQLLDDYCGHNETLLHEYKSVFSALSETQKSLEQATQKSKEMAQRADYIKYQLEEIEKVNPTVDDEKDLINIKNRYKAVQENKTQLQEINHLFDGDDNQQGLLPLMRSLEHKMNSEIFTEEERNQYFTAQGILSDLNYSLNSKDEFNVNEEDLSFAIDRLDSYQKLKRKFQVDTEGLIILQQDFLTEEIEVDNISSSILVLEERLSDLKAQAFNLAGVLHKKRSQNAEKLSKTLTTEVQSLNMKGAQIVFELSQSEELSSTGFSSVNFIAETNPGEGFFRIKEIASGGELSRILLSVRNILSSKDSISIFLFDEIDTGIGGETALTIGKSLATIAQESQVIAITHLPQIANHADKLIIVSKELIDNEDDKRTISKIKEVMGLDLKTEVSLMTPLN